MGHGGLRGAISDAINLFKTILTTKGDLLTYSTTPIRLGVGANNTVLTADSTQAAGIKWAAVTSTASTSQTASNSGNQTTSSTSFVDITSVTITLPNTGKKCLVVLSCSFSNNTLAGDSFFTISDNGTDQSPNFASVQSVFVANYNQYCSIGYITTQSGQIVKGRAKVGSGTNTLTLYGSADQRCTISTLELGA